MSDASVGGELDWLVYRNDDPGRRIPLPPGRKWISIGSSDLTDIQIEHPSVSKRHARLYWQEKRNGWALSNNTERSKKVPLASPGPVEFLVGDVSLMLVGEPQEVEAPGRFGFSRGLLRVPRLPSPYGLGRPRALKTVARESSAWINAGLFEQYALNITMALVISVFVAQMVASNYVLNKSHEGAVGSAKMGAAAIGLVSVVALFVLLLFVRILPFRTSCFGLTFKNGWDSLRDGVFVSGLILSLGMATRWLATGVLCDEYAAGRDLQPGRLLIYGLVVFFQDIAVWGFVFTFYERLFLTRIRTTIAYFVAVSIYATSHMFASNEFAAVTFGLGMIFGLLFMRWRSLVGVLVAHFVIGILGTFCAGSLLFH